MTTASPNHPAVEGATPGLYHIVWRLKSPVLLSEETLRLRETVFPLFFDPITSQIPRRLVLVPSGLRGNVLEQNDSIMTASINVATTPVATAVVLRDKEDRLNLRIDGVLKENERSEKLVFVLMTILFSAGLALFVAGYALREPLMLGGGAVAEVGLVFPINKILSLRTTKINLQTFPSMLQLIEDPLRKDKAVTEFMNKIYDMRGKS